MPVAETTAADPADAIAARLPVTDKRAWSLLIAIALLVLAGVVWAVLGRAPETVRGPGMLVPTDGFVEVGTLVSGRVSELLVNPGDPIRAGQPVAFLTTPDGESQEVRAPVDGSVATVVVRQGGTTESGTPLLTLDPARGGNVAVGFLPAEQGARVRVGMPALVSVASLPQAQYGYLKGTVKAVALLPVTADRVELLTGGNARLPEFFMAAGPVIEVTVTLDPDPSTPTGYAWTTGDGPDADLSTGTLAQVSVVLSDSAPLQRLTG